MYGSDRNGGALLAHAVPQGRIVHDGGGVCRRSIVSDCAQAPWFLLSLELELIDINPGDFPGKRLEPSDHLLVLLDHGRLVFGNSRSLNQFYASLQAGLVFDDLVDFLEYFTHVPIPRYSVMAVSKLLIISGRTILRISPSLTFVESMATPH